MQMNENTISPATEFTMEILLHWEQMHRTCSSK